MSPETARESPQPDAGRRIGRYRLLRRLGTGGMGSVFEAEQDEPRRTVALKLLERTEDPEAIARFRYESQILAQLSHSGIAQVFEAGVEREGEGDLAREQPWFAMEHVPGARTLLEYAEEQALDLAARLRLFARVAEAVHHGHQRGVIHRDLKPANILVGEAGQPKVIDFGVARLTADAARRGLRTSTGQVLGTLRYMSPEQVTGPGSGGGGAVDSRSDVFALGLVLFELAARRPAYDLDGLSLAEAVATVAGARVPALRSVAPRLPRELEWIVQRATALEHERRYPSVSELAGDVERLLADRPVGAAPPDTWYRVRSFGRRHRAAVAAALVVVASLAGSLFVLARSLRIERALLASERAEHRRAQGNAEFLSEMLTSVSPAHEGYDVRVLELLDQAAPRIAERFAEQPLLRSDLHFAIGDAYRALARFEVALEHARAALALRLEVLGARDPATLAAKQLVGFTLRGAGKLAEAEPILRECLAEAERSLGARDLGALRVRASLIDLELDTGRVGEARRLLDEAASGLTPETFVLDEAGLLLVERELRLLLEAQDSEALRAWMLRLEDEWNRLPESSREVLGGALRDRGAVLAGAGRLDEAEAVLLEDLERAQRLFGPRGQPTVALRANLGNVAVLRGDGAAALAWIDEALADAEAGLGPEHPVTWDVRYARCGALWTAGEKQRATSDLSALLADSRRVFPLGHAGTADWAGSLGRMHVAGGRPADGVSYLEESVALSAAAHGDGHPSTQRSLRWLVRALEECGRVDEADALRPRVLPGGM